MARAVEQHIPLDEDRWTLDQPFDYLTVTLGYPGKRALHEMEQYRLVGRLRIKVQKVVAGKTQGDPEYLLPDKKHKLVRDLGWVRPLALKWGWDHCTVYKLRVLELWPLRPQEARAGPDPFKVDASRPAAAQRRPSKASKPDSGAKPSSAEECRDAAIKTRLDKGEKPGSTGTWAKFYNAIRTDCDAFVGERMAAWPRRQPVRPAWQSPRSRIADKDERRFGATLESSESPQLVAL
jgi:hypothetical protein